MTDDPAETLAGAQCVGEEPIGFSDSQGMKMDQAIVAAFALMLVGRSPEYQEGYAAGYAEAVRAVERNRDHFMRLVPGFKFETHDEAMRRIYSSPWSEQHEEGGAVVRAQGSE